MARGWHYTKLSLSSALLLSFGMLCFFVVFIYLFYFFIVPFFLSFFVWCCFVLLFLKKI